MSELSPAAAVARYVRILVHGVSSSNQKAEALTKLRALSSNDRRNKDLIRDHGAIPYVVRALAGKNESNTVTLALSLLRSLSVNEQNQAAIAEAGAIPLLFQCLQSQREVLQTNASAVLWNLASDPENKATIGDTGGVGMLLRLLQRTSSMRVKTEVCGALRNLSCRYDNLQYFAQQEGGIATLAEVLMLRREHSDDVRKNVAVALNMCMQHPLARREIERANCMSTLLTTLREFSIELTPETEKQLTLLERGGDANLRLKTHSTAHRTNSVRNKGGSGHDSPKENQTDLCVAIGGSNVSNKHTSSTNAASAFNSIAWSGLNLGKEIGKGSFSRVYAAQYNGYSVAAKVLKDSLPEDERSRRQLLQEYQMLAAIRHPNVILLMGTSLTPEMQPLFVFELCSRGALKDVLPSERSMLRRLKFGKDIVAGLNWLHAHNIVHRDLKCANILIDEEYTAKISDLGLALFYHENVICRCFKGNIKYSAPEILRARANKATRLYPYGPQTDVYSFGLILWELVTRQPLFQGIHGTENITTFVSDGHRPPLVPGWPMSLQNMLNACWHDKPSRRPQFIAIQRDFPAVMVDVMCPDPVARKVCRELWAGMETRSVSYDEFERAFQTITNVDLSTASLCYRRCLQRMLCDSYDHRVTFERVCNMVHTFGSMQPIDEFLHRVITLFEQPWFFGYVRVCDARQMLQEQCALSPAGGYYMIRFSDSMPGSFSLLSIDASGAIERRRIGHQYSSEYFVTIGDSEHVFPSLFSLQQYCAEAQDVCFNKQPLPGSPFQCLFAANPIQGGSALSQNDANA